MQRAVPAIQNLIEEYYNTVQAGIERGLSNVPPTVVPLYPTMLLATVTRDHLIIELSGAARRFDGLAVAYHSEHSTSRYLSRFHDSADDPILNIDTAYLTLDRIPVIDTTDASVIKDRFPAVRGLNSRYRLTGKSGSGCLIRISSDAVAVIMLDCLLVHHVNNAYSVRNPQCLFILSKAAATVDTVTNLRKTFDPNVQLKGVLFAPRSIVEHYLLAGQLQSLYMIPNLRETTIGAFLRDHPSILVDAVSGSELVYEPYCEWQVRAPDPDDVAINPDAFVVRKDGCCDVYDLKKPLLSTASVTAGPSRRRRFIAYVADGIAQLAHYRDYLSRPENVAHVEERYGVRFKDPRFRLIVGF